MGEIGEVIRKRKEKISKILSDTAAVEEIFLSDIECNLVNGLTLAKESIAALESSNKALLDALAARDIELSRSVNEASELQIIINRQVERLTILEGEQKRNSGKDDAFKAWITAEDASMEAIKLRLEGLGEALRIKEEKLAALTIEHSTCHKFVEKCSVLEESLRSTSISLESQTAEKKSLQERLKTAESSLALVEAQLEAKTTAYWKLEKDMSDNIALKVEIEVNLSKTKIMLDETEGALHATRTRFDEAEVLSKSLRKRADDGEKENRKLNARIVELESALLKTEGSLAELKISSSSRIAELTASLAAKSSAFDDASVELAGSKKTIENLVAQLNQLKSDDKVRLEVIRVQKAKLEQTSNEIVSLKKEIEDMKSLLKDAEKVQANLNVEILSLNGELLSRGRELQESRSDNEQLKLKLESQRKDITALHADKDRISKESLSRETAKYFVAVDVSDSL